MEFFSVAHHESPTDQSSDLGCLPILPPPMPHPHQISALLTFLPSINDDAEIFPTYPWPPLDAYSDDDFRMYEFKVRRCTRARNHDWTECPFKHPGEKASRRDLRKVRYVSTPCPDLRKGSCKKGDACEYAHGVFECWLHPARYRTQPCKDRTNCKRRVCFFAHTQEQLRLPSPISSTSTSLHSSPKQSLSRSLHSISPASHGYGDCTKLLEDTSYTTSSPRINHHLQQIGNDISSCGSLLSTSSPTSILVRHSHSPPSLSPPLSPSRSSQLSTDLFNTWPHDLARSLAAQSSSSLSSPVNHSGPLRNLDTMRVPVISIPPLDTRVALGYSSDTAVDSLPPQAMSGILASLQNLNLKGSLSHQANATGSPDQWLLQPQLAFDDQVFPTLIGGAARSGLWESSEIGMEPATGRRVESGRYIRAKIYEKLAKENVVESEVPDIGWVNNLVK